MGRPLDEVRAPRDEITDRVEALVAELDTTVHEKVKPSA